MTIWDAIISGILQGITEFLPVSSSGHLVILHRLLGLEAPQILFDIFLHIGTLFAILVIFKKDIAGLFNGEKTNIFFIIIGSLVTFLFVILFNENIEMAFGNARYVGVMLVVTGVWLILGDFVRFGTGEITFTKAVLIGLAQGIAVYPGISRSGSTISTGLFLGLEPRTAARFSFLLSIPTIIGAFLFKLKAVRVAEVLFNANYLIGLVVSFIVGIFALKILLRTLERHKFYLFGVYCIVIGFSSLLFLR